MSFKFGKNGGKGASHVTHLIDVATDATSQPSENWTLFMEICDIINASEEGPKDAVKAFRKKFATKNPPTINLSLSLLETCVKNCGKRFHIQIATKDFLQDFIKIVSPKHSPPIELQMKVLGLLQTWAHAFQASPELKEVCKQYQDLKSKGVEFPSLDMEKASQAHIPSRSTPTVAVTDLRTVSTRMPCRTASTGMRPAGQAGAPGSALTPDHLAKLHSELNTVQQNCRVFGDMLTELTPGQENRSDVELLEDLNMTCRQMQKRIMELIQSVQVEQVTEELLRVNDELNNVFLRYDRYQRMRSNQSNTKPMQPAGAEFPVPPHRAPSTFAGSSAMPAPPMYPPAAGTVAVDNLIDLGETPSPKPPAPYPGFEGQFANMSMNVGTGRSGNDDFNSFPASMETGRSNAGMEAAQIGHDSDFAEIEKWLMENSGGGSGAAGETATSSEFDRFLAERAKEADCLPPSVHSAPGQRSTTLKKNDEAPLFSL